MQPINPIQIRNLGVYGVIREAEVDNNLIPDGAVVKAVNVNFDRKGAVQLRPGITLIAQAYANPILGLHNALFSTASNNCILAVASNGSNNIIYKSTGGAFAQSLTGDTNSSPDFLVRRYRPDHLNRRSRAGNARNRDVFSAYVGKRKLNPRE